MAANRFNRVLLVDDSRLIRESVKFQLAKQGYEVTCATGGEAALRELGFAGGADGGGAPDFDLVLLDNLMPDINGIDVLRRVRQRHSPIDLPVIMVTSMDESADIVEALKAGANDYVTKPVDFPVLLVRLETHVALKRSHDEVRDSHRSLLNAARMDSVARLAAGVAHEIRNPLAQVQMGVDGARGALNETNPVAAEFLDLTTQAVERANEIVTNLVSYSKSSSLQLAESDLNGFVRESLQLLTEELARTNTRVTLALADPGPVALISKDDLRQVFLNLVFNAAQAMPEGGEVIVRTGTRVVTGLPASAGSRAGAMLRNDETAAFFALEDHGTGIAEVDLPKVFDPFFTSKATGVRQGRGLGLTVARQLVELHGGWIQVSNRTDGKGVVAEVLLRQRETALL